MTLHLLRVGVVATGMFMTIPSDPSAITDDIIATLNRGIFLNADPSTGKLLGITQLEELSAVIDRTINEVRMRNTTNDTEALAQSSLELVRWWAVPQRDVTSRVPSEVEFLLAKSMEGYLAWTSRELLRSLDLIRVLETALFAPSALGDVATHFITWAIICGQLCPWSNSALTDVMVVHLEYDKDIFLDPSLGALQTLLEDRTNTGINSAMIGMIVCVIVIIGCGGLLIPMFIRLGEGAIWSLKLLLFCPPNVVLQAVSIQKVLSNDFSGFDDRDEDGGRLFESVVSHLLDAVLFLSTDLKVISMNHATEAVLGIPAEKVIGQSLENLFEPAEGSTAVGSFLNMVSGAMNSHRSPSIEADVEIKRDGVTAAVHIQMIAISWSGRVQTKALNRYGMAIIVMMIRDITSAVAADKLLREEGLKSEKLLLMILPPIIVKKLQGGEKNISFSVKSASILFLDIVSFTPWCGSHEAAYIMGTLNRMFLEYDRLIKQYDRLTKIKCIGDCYMCAGGLFDEFNQPQIHAEQMISFGLDMIHALQLLNIELSETLQMRVGVNTGGPIVAGVLGIDKPTFDILGPPICLAAAMEHHGMPMAVHIPQHCYDLVYEFNFVMKERGNVEVKGKQYHTYLVTGYK
jgi:class 3 adenylate cyclase/PAS domain-containing protein